MQRLNEAEVYLQENRRSLGRLRLVCMVADVYFYGQEKTNERHTFLGGGGAEPAKKKFLSAGSYQVAHLK